MIWTQERLLASDCKSDALAGFVGSNPTHLTRGNSNDNNTRYQPMTISINEHFNYWPLPNKKEITAGKMFSLLESSGLVSEPNYRQILRDYDGVPVFYTPAFIFFVKGYFLAFAMANEGDDIKYYIFGEDDEWIRYGKDIVKFNS